MEDTDLDGNLENSERSYYSQDHLGGTALVTDSSGVVSQLYDYYSYGSELLDSQPTGASVPSEHSFTDKELDDDLGLYYFEARWYDSDIGRFSGQDPAQLDDRIGKMLADPQSLNFYSYSRNNPVILVDRDGEYWETAIDIIFFTLSTRDFYLNPSLTTGAWATLDGLGVALPVPAVAGYIKNGAKAYKIVNYFQSVSNYTGKSITKIAETFAENAFFKQTRRSWTSGNAGDSLGNLVGHYEKHGGEFNVKSVQDYYNKANDFLDSGDYKTWKEGGTNINYNPSSNTAVYTDSNGNIKSMYTITDETKYAQYQEKAASIK